ncbi:MAG: PH domain-containing protein [Actinomycetota bacterium]|nr:PH domain-containing protein [Actinomycetota bacterium]
MAEPAVAVDPKQAQTWSTPYAWVVGQAGAAALFAVVGARAEPAGRLLAGIACLLLLAGALRDATLRPTLRADRDGVAVRQGRQMRQLGWAELTSCRATSGARRLVRTSSVELDLGDELLLLPVRRLGAPAAAVTARLEELAALAEGER